MATRREILETELSEEAAQRAVINAWEHWHPEEWLDVEVEDTTAKELLREAFIWHTSPEGLGYWGERAVGKKK